MHSNQLVIFAAYIYIYIFFLFLSMPRVILVSVNSLEKKRERERERENINCKIEHSLNTYIYQISYENDELNGLAISPTDSSASIFYTIKVKLKKKRNEKELLYFLFLTKALFTIRTR